LVENNNMEPKIKRKVKRIMGWITLLQIIPIIAMLSGLMYHVEIPLAYLVGWGFNVFILASAGIIKFLQWCFE
jgi:hypothetical protein